MEHLSLDISCTHEVLIPEAKVRTMLGKRARNVSSMVMILKMGKLLAMNSNRADC